MVDGSRALDEEDEEILQYMDGRQAIVVLNKQDLTQVVSREEIAARVPQAVIIDASMKEGMGIETIEDKIEELVYGGQVKQNDSIMVTNVRHKNLLELALQSVEDASAMTEMRQPLEFIEIDVNRSYELLGEIIGETASGEIINEVFARFCLGK